MYCEHKGAFKRLVGGEWVSENPVIAVVSTKRARGDIPPCAFCVFSERRDPNIYGCGDHHCSHYGWIKNIDPNVDDYAEACGYVRDPKGSYFLDIRGESPEFFSTSFLDWNPRHLVLWRKL